MRQSVKKSEPEYCLMCFKEIHQGGDVFRLLFQTDLLCAKCRASWIKRNQRFIFEQVPARVLWQYNEGFSSALLQYKECYDEALKDIFLFPFVAQLKRQYQKYTLLCMPSTKQNSLRRGFSHLEQMFAQLQLPLRSPFEKVVEVNQKDLSRQARQEMVGHIRLVEDISDCHHILLVDDVLTTGSTLKAALACLDLRVYHVEILVCARVESLSCCVQSIRGI